MVQAKPVPKKKRQFLKNSQCGFKEVPFVCCADDSDDDDETEKASKVEETTESSTAMPEGSEPEWLIELKKAVPQPPNCGQYSQDRIFGGSETELDEFTWTVLLEYKKR